MLDATRATTTTPTPPAFATLRRIARCFASAFFGAKNGGRRPPMPPHKGEGSARLKRAHVPEGLFAARGGNHANDRSCRGRAHRHGVDRDLCRCRELVRDLSAGQYQLQLFLLGGMHGHSARPWRILPTQSIPRVGLRDLRRGLESPRHAQALSPRLLVQARQLRS